MKAEKFNEYSAFAFCNPVKLQTKEKVKLRDELESGVATFLENGGQITTLDKTQYQTFRSPCFDKSQDELRDLAKKHKRKTFTYWCDEHGICQFSVKKNTCIRCEVKHESDKNTV